MRRYREHLYLLPEIAEISVAGSNGRSGEQVDWRRWARRIAVCPDAADGLSDAVIGTGWRFDIAVGGEEFKPVGQSHTRKLKKLLQEEGVVPWMRERLPLLYSGGELVAVADLWIAAAQ